MSAAYEKLLAVAVPNELDGNSIDAGVTGLLTRRQRRQCAIVRAREVPTDIGDIGGHQMEVVEQPLRRLGSIVKLAARASARSSSPSMLKSSSRSGFSSGDA